MKASGKRDKKTVRALITTRVELNSTESGAMINDMGTARSNLLITISWKATLIMEWFKVKGSYFTDQEQFIMVISKMIKLKVLDVILRSIGRDILVVGLTASYMELL